MPIVEVPGQGLVEFPDNMSDDQIASVIRKNMQPAQQEAGFLEGAAQQVGRNIDVAASNVGKMIPSIDALGQMLGLPSSRQVLASRKDKPISTASRVVGDIATGLPTLAIPGAQGLAAQAGIGAALGGLTAEQDQVRSAAYGAAIPLALRGLGKAVSGATLTPEQRLLRESGVQMTPGQIAGGGTQVVEDVLAGLPYVGDPIATARRNALEQFNRGAYQRSLGGASEVLPSSVGREGVADLKDIGRGLYDKALSGTVFQADPALASAYQNIRQNLGMGAGGQGAVAEFDRIVMGNINPRITGRITGEQYKGIESDIGKIAKSLMGGTTQEREAAIALKGLQREMKLNLARQNPEAAQSLSKADRAYAGYKVVSGASKTAQEANEGLFTPQQLVQSVRQADQTLGKDAYARGAALLQDYAAAGQRVLPQKLPDSGTAARGMVPALIAGGGSALGMIDPSASVLAGILPAAYSKTGMKIIENLLASRPEIAVKAGQTISKAAQPLSMGLLGEFR